MRILGITNALPPEGYGYGAICVDVMDCLARRGHDVRLLAARGNDPGSVPTELTLAEVPAGWRKPLAGRRAAVQNAAALEAALSPRPDAAVVWHMRGIGKGVLGRLHEAGVRVVYMVGDLWAAYEHPGPPALWPAWQRGERSRAYRTARDTLRRLAGAGNYPPIAEVGAVCFASRWLMQRYEELGFAPREVYVVPNGIELGEAPGMRPPLTGRAARLAFVGRLDRTKGVDTAVHALAAIPDAGLDLVGGASTRDLQAVGRLVKRLGLDNRVHFRGLLDRADAMSVLREADAFLMPGRIEEAFGLVYLEAMAAGAAVVGTALGGAQEICSHERNALVVPPGDHAAAAAAVTRILQDAELRERLVSAGRATAAQFSLDQMTAQVERVCVTRS